LTNSYLGSFNEYLSIVTILQKELKANCHSNSKKKSLVQKFGQDLEKFKKIVLRK